MREMLEHVEVAHKVIILWYYVSIQRYGARLYIEQPLCSQRIRPSVLCFSRRSLFQVWTNKHDRISEHGSLMQQLAVIATMVSSCSQCALFVAAAISEVRNKNVDLTTADRPRTKS